MLSNQEEEMTNRKKEPTCYCTQRLLVLQRPRLLLCPHLRLVLLRLPCCAYPWTTYTRGIACACASFPTLLNNCSMKHLVQHTSENR
jgi:hypothetical protein